MRRCVLLEAGAHLVLTGVYAPGPRLEPVCRFGLLNCAELDFMPASSPPSPRMSASVELPPLWFLPGSYAPVPHRGCLIGEPQPV